MTNIERLENLKSDIYAIKHEIIETKQLLDSLCKDLDNKKSELKNLEKEISKDCKHDFGEEFKNLGFEFGTCLICKKEIPIFDIKPFVDVCPFCNSKDGLYLTEEDCGDYAPAFYIQDRNFHFGCNCERADTFGTLPYIIFHWNNRKGKEK